MNSNNKQSVVSKAVLVPFILITSLFALWGLANDMTNPMVRGFQKVLELSNTQASLVQLAFYGGYFTMALPAALFVNKFSYKKGVLLGLALYSIGALLFWPAAAKESYGFFLSALYIMTFGLAFLENSISSIGFFSLKRSKVDFLFPTQPEDRITLNIKLDKRSFFILPWLSSLPLF